ncbi:hypothetical protein FB45DRAFT_906536 [Roridomyces roridus]|uniref:Uncharacterized protein n=1 Tax=Roridomyces roridus TaxID=1738132 RepID=A0AAD7C152_9AGAR|nr:hypothetical protein FB45DRAFT_906536 [Roridomyces roridus]
MTASAAAVPPTTHDLDKPQRLRLMRSHRKLSALLGTPPLLLDSTPPPMPNLRCPDIGSAFRDTDVEDEPTSTITLVPAPHPPSPSSTEAKPKSKWRPRRPTLLVRIQSAPASSALPTLKSATHTRSRTADDACTPPLPLDATSTESRRRKIARLTRRLGEPVPPELVFGIPSSAPSPTSRTPTVATKRHRVQSVTSRTTTEKPSLSSISSISSMGSSSGWWDTRSGSSDHEKPSHDSTYSSKHRPSNSISSTRSSVGVTSTTRSMATESPPASPTVFPPSRFATVRRNGSRSKQNQDPIRRSVMTRSEVGWSGGWNADEATVVKELRGLKV